MTISICKNCPHEQSNCKGVKNIEKVECDYFNQKLAIDYKKEAFGITSARIKELEYELDICQAKAYEYDKLYDKYVELVADNKTLMQKNTSEYELNEALLLRADRLEAERNELKAENKKLKAKIEQRVECGADCDKCKNKCRAWQNGYNATCERECDNCEVIADMQSLKNVLNKLLFDYADDLRGDTE